MRTRAWILLLALLGVPPAAAAPRLAPDSTRERALEAGIVAFAHERFGIELRSEEPLRAAARELSLVRAAGLEVQPHEFLRQAESRHGVLDPFPYVFYGSAPAGREATIAERLRQHLEALSPRERRLYTHVVAGVVEQRVRRFLLPTRRTVFVTLLLSQRALSFTPFPADLEPGARFEFEGEVHAPFREPQILLTRPDGRVSTLDDLSRDARSFRSWVVLDAGPGEYQLEVLARDDMGPRVLGLCSLHALPAGQRPVHERLLAAAREGTLAAPKRPLPESTVPTATPAEAEQRMLFLLNRDRRRAGLRPLELDPELETMARAHSRDMLRNDFFAHVSPRSGRLVERAESAGVRYARLGENIAVHGDVDAAEAALLRSPGHRVNILDPSFTHVGIGIAFGTDTDGERRMYITQNFMVPAP